MRNVGVYQRSDGRTEARIPIGTGENGKPKFRYILRQSRDTVLEAVEELLSEMRSQKSATCGLSFGTVFEEWYLRTKHRVKESTAANYRLKADKHILPWFGDKTVSSDIDNFRARYLCSIHQEKKESPRSHVWAFRCKAVVFRSTSKSPTRQNVEALVSESGGIRFSLSVPPPS